MADPASVYRQGNSSPHMDELLINRRYWYYRLRCPRQPARHPPAATFSDTNLCSQRRHLISSCGPSCTQAALSWNCAQWRIFSEGRGWIQFVPQIRVCISTGGWKRFLSSVHVADTNKNSNSKASVIHVFESGVCSPGFERLVVCNTFIFLSVSFSFPQSVPKPIALEPCFGNKAAVLSIFVRLPRGTGGIPPPGQSGKTPSLAFFPLSSISV